MSTHAFRFLDVDFTVSSTWQPLLDRFCAHYARQRRDSAPLDARRYQYDGDSACLSVGKQSWRMDPSLARSALWLQEVIEGDVLRQVKAYDLLHAGVLARQGRGFMVSGDTMHGKTTLTLALVQAGAFFLSDEHAAVARADDQLVPFARRVGIRPNTMTLLDLTPHSDDPVERDGRRFADVAAIRPNALSGPVPLRTLFLLASPTAASESTTVHHVLVVNELQQSWIESLNSIDGVSVVRVAQRGALPAVLVAVSNPQTAFAGINEMCDKFGVLLVNIHPFQPPQPAFDQAPVFRPIPRTDAALRLLQQYQNGLASAAFASAYGGDPLQLYLRLARLLEPVACYELQVGYLADSVAGILARVE